MDLVAHSFNGFPAPTAAEFGNFLKAIAASGPGAAKPTPVEQYLQLHPNAVPFATQQKPPPESFATTTYFGVNAFAFADASGKETALRYRIVPEAGEKYLDAATAASKGPRYLMEEIAARVAKAPAILDWFAQIAKADDKTDDPSTPWPEDRQRWSRTLTITGIAADQEGLSKSLLFLPNNVPAGKTGRSDDRGARRRLPHFLWRTSIAVRFWSPNGISSQDQNLSAMHLKADLYVSGGHS